jgi:endo-1,4-beta-xylanase
MNTTHELITSAPERIRDIRSADFTLTLLDSQGAPIGPAEARVELTHHAFKFGSNAFNIGAIQDATLQAAYEERYAALLNYATLPFYWGNYELEPGTTREAHLHAMAAWCASHGITTKGHPLAWHEVFPRWAADFPDGEILNRLEARIRNIPQQFKGEVDIWDVVNEATVSQRFDNAVGRWVAREGAATVVDTALRWAREGNPDATLLYNDFNIAEDFETLVADLLDRGAPVDVLGIQSHMHVGTWPLERAWTTCNTYARFGLPLHFTELTILSGRLKAQDDKDWHTPRPGWDTTPEGEAAQAAFGAALYTLLFSHPAVEAITWWDFSDYHAWQAAPAGLIRADMSPKPLYERLMELVHGEWQTDIKASTGEGGELPCRCFFGEHRVTATLPSGDRLYGTFSAAKEGARTVRVSLAPQTS